MHNEHHIVTNAQFYARINRRASESTALKGAAAQQFAAPVNGPPAASFPANTRSLGYFKGPRTANPNSRIAKPTVTRPYSVAGITPAMLRGDVNPTKPATATAETQTPDEFEKASPLVQQLNSEIAYLRTRIHSKSLKLRIKKATLADVSRQRDSLSDKLAAKAAKLKGIRTRVEANLAEITAEHDSLLAAAIRDRDAALAESAAARAELKAIKEAAATARAADIRTISTWQRTASDVRINRDINSNWPTGKSISTWWP